MSGPTVSAPWVVPATYRARRVHRRGEEGFVRGGPQRRRPPRLEPVVQVDHEGVAPPRGEPPWGVSVRVGLGDIGWLKDLPTHTEPSGVTVTPFTASPPGPPSTRC